MHTDQSSTTTFLNPLPIYQTPLPTRVLQASDLASESERELTRDQSSRASLRSVSPSCSHPSFHPSLSVLVVSATVSKGNNNHPPDKLMLMVKENVQA